MSNERHAEKKSGLFYKEITPETFSRFISWLHPDPVLAGAKYVSFHRDLRAFFAREHDAWVDELASNALDRAAAIFATGGAGDCNPWLFVLSVARYIRKEHHRQQRKFRSLDCVPELRAVLPASGIPRLALIERALERLPEHERQLLIEWNSGIRRGDNKRIRKEIAARCGVRASAMRKRICTLMKKLAAAAKETRKRSDGRPSAGLAASFHKAGFSGRKCV